MERRHEILILTIAGTLMAAPMGLAQGVVPNPVVNPGFETSLPEAESLHGTPADECIGIGHQVFYGENTTQQHADDSANASANADPEKGEANASAEADGRPAQNGAEEAAADPEGEARFQSGYGHCVFSDEEGQDVAWINPVRLAGDDAAHWSGHDDDTVADVDGDGDREIAIPTKPDTTHNLWQAWPSPFQAFTGNFEALEFDVEDGAVPDGALVQVSLSATPMNNQTAELVLFRDCAINFPGSLINGHTTDGHVHVPPTEAGFTDTGDEHCEDMGEAWEDADDDERREILGRLRVVQLSFWRFNASAEDPDCGCSVQLDNISLSHATTVAEEAARANVQVGPDLVPEEVPE